MKKKIPRTWGNYIEGEILNCTKKNNLKLKWARDNKVQNKNKKASLLYGTKWKQNKNNIFLDESKILE